MILDPTPATRCVGWYPRFLWISAILSLHVDALAQASKHPTSPNNKSESSVNICPNNNDNILDVPKLQQAIRAGRAYQQFDFLSEDEVANVMWKEIRHLENSGGFLRSGLSNTAQGESQNFGEKDRTLCPAPWWSDSLLGVDLSVKTSPSSSSSSPADTTISSAVKGIGPIASRIQDLRLSLASILDRPTMNDKSLAHECYYSMSMIGSSLPRHTDERHEELKGAKGWLLQSRRSLSWLIYLSDPIDWSLEEHGGALRSFPPQSISVPETGQEGQLTQDNGNLQIGWLLDTSTGGSSDSNNTITKTYGQPVYLDSWFPISSQPGEPLEPHCILYTRDPRNRKNKIILTKPWLTEYLQGISLADFLQTWAVRQRSSETGDSGDGNDSNADADGLFLDPKYAQQFALIENRPAWDEGFLPEGTVAEDVLPKRGSLVIFDSVTLPHQVELIKKGKRVALAGWFHEATQAFPEGLYS